MKTILGCILSLLFVSAPIQARGSRSRSYTSKSRTVATSHVRAPHSSKVGSSHSARVRAPRSSASCLSCARDSHGRIKRSESAKKQFERQNPCPATGKTSGSCPGYVVDHVQALKHGGADTPGNMQWQTKAAAKAKDRWE